MTDMIARGMAQSALKKAGISTYLSKDSFPTIGQDGAMYLDSDTNTVYYWEDKSLSYKIFPLSTSETVTKTQVVETINSSILIGGTASK
jgi:hypothetical protein